jgi:hypothetical protein
MIPKNQNELYAYTIGYFDGRSIGISNLPENEQMRFFYKLGYDFGITDYCELEIEEIQK